MGKKINFAADEQGINFNLVISTCIFLEIESEFLYKNYMRVLIILTGFVVFLLLSSNSSWSAYYSVKKGDSLILISKKLGVKPYVIKALNPHVNWRRIRPGQKIVVPDSHGTVKYTIKKGDTLIGIAKRFKISYRLIKAYNPHVNWRRVRPGQTILLPLKHRRRIAFKGKKQKEASVKGSLKKTHLSPSVSSQPKTLVSKSRNAGNIPLSSIEEFKQLNPDIDWSKIENSAVLNRFSSRQKTQPVEKQLLKGLVVSSCSVSKAPRKKQTAEARNERLMKKIFKNRKKLKPGEVGDGFYVVARGDTLSSIARRFGLSLKEIEELNPGKRRFIRPGDIIVLPGKLTQKIMISRREGLYIPIKYLLYSEPYRVKRGDNLWKLARKFHTRIYMIKMLNNLNSNRLRVGQIIFVPEKNLPGMDRLKLEYSILQEKRRALVSYAERFIGRPYKFGGDSLLHGIDCSAFVQKIFGKFHIYLPRTAEEQYRTAGVFVPLSQIRVGDLLFFHTMNYAKVTHVGIYVGHDRFIHAAGRRSGIKISRLNSYYRKRLVAVKRVLNLNNKYAYNRHRSR